MKVLSLLLVSLFWIAPARAESLSDKVQACLQGLNEPAQDLTGKTTTELEEKLNQVVEAKRSSIEDYFFVQGLLSAYDKKLRSEGKTPNFTSQEFQDGFAKAIAERTSLLVDKNAGNLMALSALLSGKCTKIFTSTDVLIEEYGKVAAGRVQKAFKDKLSLRVKKRIEDELVSSLFQKPDSKKKPFPFDQVDKANLRIEGYLTALFTQERSDLEEQAATAGAPGAVPATTDTHYEK